MAAPQRKLRSILRDSIQGITKPKITRLQRRAAIYSAEAENFEEIRGTMKVWLEDVLSDTVAVAEHERRKIVVPQNVRTALALRGVTVAIPIPEGAKTKQGTETEGPEPEVEPEPEPETEAQPAVVPAAQRNRRFKHRTVALREIRREQRNSEAPIFGYEPFARLVKEIIQDYTDTLKTPKQTIKYIQLLCEDYLTRLLVDANRCAIHAGRVTLKPADIILARSLRHDSQTGVQAAVSPPEDLNYLTYIKRVQKEVHPDLGITGKAAKEVNRLVLDVLGKIVNAANLIMGAERGKSTITSREIQTGVRLALPGELRKHSIQAGTTAVTKYYTPNPKGDQTSRAGLVFAVPRTGNAIRRMMTAERLGKGAGVYAAAVLEYIVREILELAGNAARDLRRKRIIPRHILLAIRGDEELDHLFSAETTILGGMIPYIPRAVLGPANYPEEIEHS